MTDILISKPGVVSNVSARRGIIDGVTVMDVGALNITDILPGTFYSKREIYQCVSNVIKTTPTTSDKLFIK